MMVLNIQVCPVREPKWAGRDLPPKTNFRTRGRQDCYKLAHRFMTGRDQDFHIKADLNTLENVVYKLGCKASAKFWENHSNSLLA